MLDYVKINLFDNLKAKRFNLFKFRDVTWTYSEDATGYFIICHQKDRKATTQDRKNLVYSCGFPPRRNWLDINLIFINFLSLIIHSYFLSKYNNGCFTGAITDISMKGAFYPPTPGRVYVRAKWSCKQFILIINRHTFNLYQQPKYSRLFCLS